MLLSALMPQERSVKSTAMTQVIAIHLQRSLAANMLLLLLLAPLRLLLLHLKPVVPLLMASSFSHLLPTAGFTAAARPAATVESVTLFVTDAPTANATSAGGTSSTSCCTRYRAQHIISAMWLLFCLKEDLSQLLLHCWSGIGANCSASPT